MAIAYGATLVTVGAQRRGGARGWAGVQTLLESISRAIPRRHARLQSADAALFWIEWRRSGLVLPASVLLTSILILTLTIRFTDGGAKATMWAESWLGLITILLAVPIGMGFGKPDFWSLDLSLPTFVTARPISAGQLVAAKMKVAAVSTLLAWTALLLIAPLCVYIYLDTEHWPEMWETLRVLYSPMSQWAVPILGVVMAMVLTWSLLIGNICLGYSGRPAFYYSLVALGMMGLLATLYFLGWWAANPRDRDILLVRVLPWLPWLLAVFVTVKVWTAAWCTHRLQQRHLISRRHIASYLCVWMAATACLMLCAWLVSPGIEWLRNLLMLAMLCLIPAARVAATPLTIAWNRHR
jgi:hypothetical protein